jgi:hypothetical protein
MLATSQPPPARGRRARTHNEARAIDAVCVFRIAPPRYRTAYILRGIQRFNGAAKANSAYSSGYISLVTSSAVPWHSVEVAEVGGGRAADDHKLSLSSTLASHRRDRQHARRSHPHQLPAVRSLCLRLRRHRCRCRWARAHPPRRAIPHLVRSICCFDASEQPVNRPRTRLGERNSTAASLSRTCTPVHHVLHCTCVPKRSTVLR